MYSKEQVIELVRDAISMAYPERYSLNSIPTKELQDEFLKEKGLIKEEGVYGGDITNEQIDNLFKYIKIKMKESK